MLSLLLIYIYIFLTTFCTGVLVVKFFEKLRIVKQSSELYKQDLLIITGTCTLIAFFNFYSLFYKVGGLFTQSILISIIIFSLIKYKQVVQSYFNFVLSIKPNKIDFILCFIFLLFALLLSYNILSTPLIYDTGLYHAQTIQWIEKYPAVPGLGNIHGRLAFNSSFFTLSALYTFNFLNIQTFYPINGFFSFLIICRIFLEIRKHVGSGNIFYLCINCFFLVFIFIKPIVLYSSSPHTDLLPVIYLYYLFLLIADNTFFEEKSFSYISVGFLLMCSTVVTIKLSTLPILLFLIYIAFYRIKWEPKMLLFCFTTTCIIILPWLIRSVVLSGYLIYPLPYIDLFSFDWKIPLENVIREKDDIKGWAIMPGPNFRDSLHMELKQWFPIWFKQKLLTDKLLFIACLFSPILVATLYFLHKEIRRYLFFWLVCFTGFIFWFFSGPDFRFGYGYMFFVAFIPVCMLIQAINAYYQLHKHLIYFLLILLYSYTIRVFPPGKILSTYYQAFFLPAPLNTVVPFVERPARNFTLRVPSVDERCFNISVPCSNYYNPDIEMRGSDFESGFRVYP